MNTMPFSFYISPLKAHSNTDFFKVVQFSSCAEKRLDYVHQSCFLH
jgi:hypothetical protein